MDLAMRHPDELRGHVWQAEKALECTMSQLDYHLKALNRFTDAMTDDVLSPEQVAQLHAASYPYLPPVTAVIDLLARQCAYDTASRVDSELSVFNPSSHWRSEAGQSCSYACASSGACSGSVLAPQCGMRACSN